LPACSIEQHALVSTASPAFISIPLDYKLRTCMS